MEICLDFRESQQSPILFIWSFRAIDNQAATTKAVTRKMTRYFGSSFMNLVRFWRLMLRKFGQGQEEKVRTASSNSYWQEEEEDKGPRSCQQAPASSTSYKMSLEAATSRENQGLLADGGGVHSQSRASQAPRRETRGTFNSIDTTPSRFGQGFISFHVSRKNDPKSTTCVAHPWRSVRSRRSSMTTTLSFPLQSAPSTM